MGEKNNRIIRWFYLFILSVIWGSSFILMKRGLNTYLPSQVAAIRMMVSFLALLPFALHRFKEIKKPDWKWIAASGLLGNGIPAYLFTVSETGISSSLAGILNSLTSMFTLIVGFLFFKSVFKARQVVGVFIGLAGACFLIWISSTDEESTHPFYSLYVIAATIGYAFSVNILKNKVSHLNSITVTGGALIFAGIPSGIYLFCTDFISRTETHPHAISSLMYILILGIMGTAISTIIFNQLIRIASAIYASSVTYLIPFMAVVWGIADEETFGLWHLLALTVIIGGIYLINTKPKTQ